MCSFAMGIVWKRSQFCNIWNCKFVPNRINILGNKSSYYICLCVILLVRNNRWMIKVAPRSLKVSGIQKYTKCTHITHTFNIYQYPQFTFMWWAMVFMSGLQLSVWLQVILLSILHNNSRSVTLPMLTSANKYQVFFKTQHHIIAVFVYFFM